ncbi:MAG: zf-HC2 domain-containing protein [Actinomycetota bacterium]
MSCGNHHNTPCTDVLHAIVLYIDHEIADQASVQAIELHIQECPPCAARTAQEALINQQLKALLNRSCREEASEQLRNNVTAFIREPSNQPYLQWTQSITYTEITSDSFTHTRVEIHERYEEE